MLRRDPRESFEVASSVDGSRDGTPTPVTATEKSAKLQAKLFAGLNKSGVLPPSSAEKRKFDEALKRADPIASPTKKLRLAGGLRDPRGLGIQYSQEA
jgi:hypothetical protein